MRKITMQMLAALIMTAGVIGCTTKGENAETTSGAGVADSIKAQNGTFTQSFQQADTAAFAKLYTEDGWMMPPSSPSIKGREGIKQFLQQSKKMGLDTIELTTGEVFVTSDSTSVETGNYKLYAGNHQQVDHGSYMVYWKKENGKWRLFRDIWNSDVVADSQSASN